MNAVDSVLNQTYKDIELIVVDDNDPETEYRTKTATLMQKYESDSRVRYICHEKNMNGAVARNTGIKAAKGDFICFLDDDDLYYTNKVEEELKYLLIHPEIDACYCWRKQFGKVIKRKDEENLTKNILLEIFCPSTPALMFRKAVLEDLGGFNPYYRRHQENELLLRFLQKYRIGYVDKVLVEVIGCDGANQLHEKELEDLDIRYINDFKLQINNIDSGKCKKKIYAHYYLEVSSDYIKHRKIERGGLFLSKAFVIDPAYTLFRIVKHLIRKTKIVSIWKNITVCKYVRGNRIE